MGMNDPFPLVSIVITSYNTAHYISRAIESALAQDYPNLEIVISDNCSTDGSDELIKRYLTDPRVRYSRNETNIGLIPNFEKAFFTLAKGDYIVNISSDDYLTDPSFISSSIRIIKCHEQVYLVFGKHQKLDEQTQVLTGITDTDYYATEFRTGEQAFLEFAEYPFFGWAGCLLDRNKLVEYGIRITTLGADIDIDLALMLKGNVGYVNRNVYTVLLHGKNATWKFKDADFYIDCVLNMYEKHYKAYLDKFGRNEAIEKWRHILLQRNITELTNLMVLQNKAQYHKFISYIRSHYPDHYQLIMKDKKHLISRYLVVPVIRNRFLRRMASALFPAKTYFKKEYQYV